MNIHTLHRSLLIVACLVLSLFVATDSYACSCGPYPNQSLCQLGDDANSPIGVANFMAIVELGDSTVAGEFITYSVNVLELLAGTMPRGDVELVQFGLGWSCAQVRYIAPGVKGVLIGDLDDGVAMPTFCALQYSFFRMTGDTVFLPLFSERGRGIDQPYTLTDFRANDCLNFSNSKEIASVDDAFSLSYDWQSEGLEIVRLDPAIRFETLAVSIYSSNGQHLLEATPSSPIDVGAFPPGMYAILIRNDQQAWSKVFVKPN